MAPGWFHCDPVRSAGLGNVSRFSIVIEELIKLKMQQVTD